MTTGFVYAIEAPSDIDLMDGRTKGRTLRGSGHKVKADWGALMSQSRRNQLTEALRAGGSGLLSRALTQSPTRTRAKAARAG